MLLVSHDREFLDRLLFQDHRNPDAVLQVFQGNYSDYLRQREAVFQRQLFAYRQYVSEKRLQETLVERRVLLKRSKSTQRMGNSEARLHKRGFG